MGYSGSRRLSMDELTRTTQWLLANRETAADKTAKQLAKECSKAIERDVSPKSIIQIAVSCDIAIRRDNKRPNTSGSLYNRLSAVEEKQARLAKLLAGLLGALDPASEYANEARRLAGEQ